MRNWMTMGTLALLCSCAGMSRANEDALSGTWRGVVRKGALESVVVFDFSRAGAGYRGNYWGMVPVATPIPLTGIDLGHSIHFEVPRLGVFEGELEKGVMEGNFQDSQGGGSFHLEKQPDSDDARLAV